MYVRTQVLYVHTFICSMYIPVLTCIDHITILFQGGFTMEVCLTQYWSDMKEATVSLKLTFHSVQPSTTALVFVSYFGALCCGHE